ncbi:hypothetical protein J1N35_028303 [Gossypium stocksii]|uniref:Uncharacterized protein n=1 Tax=Gossypium stocksii TaxID=47602 RepID=A0A9D3UVN0_9ROSI|nr:hypothetical protein J1N35_028303 [Gossypium stocksii]
MHRTTYTLALLHNIRDWYSSRLQILDAVRGGLGQLHQLGLSDYIFTDMDFEGKQDRNESSITLEYETVQEPEVNTISPTSGSDNLELSTEARTQLVREVLKGVFETRMRDTNETLQASCVDCRKKRDCSSPRLGPRSLSVLGRI